MKILRLFTIVVLAVLVLSVWAPVPAYAKQADSASKSTINLTVDPAQIKLARLRVMNRTGGTLYVVLSSPSYSYSFATADQGKHTFDPVIQPGKYTITVRTSACPGELHYKRNVKGGTVGLPGFMCRHK